MPRCEIGCCGAGPSPVILVLRDVAEGRDLGDTTTLADESVVDEIRNRAATSDES